MWADSRVIVWYEILNESLLIFREHISYVFVNTLSQPSSFTLKISEDQVVFYFYELYILAKFNPL